MQRWTGTGYTIYKHTNKVNGKVYIGQTKCKDLTRRWSGGHGYKQCRHLNGAIKIYGWENFDHEILETGLTEEEANDAEIRYIELYQSTNPEFGYNIQKGGQERSSFSPEGMASLREKFSGANSKSARGVTIFDLDGNHISDFPTATSAAKYLGVGVPRLVTACRKMSGTCANHLCFYSDDVVGIEKLPKSMLSVPNDQSSHSVPVAMYDVSGVLINTYPSVKEAGLATGVHHTQISSALSGKQMSAGGFLWRYYDDNTQLFIDQYPRERTDNGRPVCQYDMKTGELIGTYQSLADAAKSLGCNVATLHHAVQGASRSSKGFLWRYASDGLDSVPPYVPAKYGGWCKKSVYQLDKDTGEIIAVFDSVKDAAEVAGCATTTLSNYLKGRLHNGFGYDWKYVSE